MRDDHRLRNVVLGSALVALAAGCGSTDTPKARQVLAAHAERCDTKRFAALGSARRAYVGVATGGAVARRRPAGAVLARFGPKNVNGYPTVFSLRAVSKTATCRPAWYRVQLPLKPNGVTGYVRAAGLEVQAVSTRIEVDISSRRLTLFNAGRRVLEATVAVGAPATPTPLGRFYVNQRLVPDDPSGPYGPGAIGISAFSNVLTGWAQGGPVAIHGTNEPWSIGHDVSNGCIRLPNATLERLFREAVAGTPVIIRA
jgi:lipoprotein-anchoring transpeptidase ErfK/SrfK